MRRRGDTTRHPGPLTTHNAQAGRQQARGQGRRSGRRQPASPPPTCVGPARTIATAEGRQIEPSARRAGPASIADSRTRARRRDDAGAAGVGRRGTEPLDAPAAGAPAVRAPAVNGRRSIGGRVGDTAAVPSALRAVASSSRRHPASAQGGENEWGTWREVVRRRRARRHRARPGSLGSSTRVSRARRLFGARQTVHAPHNQAPRRDGPHHAHTLNYGQ